MSTVFLVEIDVVSPAGEASTLRFADRSIAPFPPTDADRPNLAYEGRLVEAPTIRRALFDDLTTLSPGLGVGAMRLANADRGLAAYQAYSWGEIRVWRWTEGTAFAAAEAVLQGLTAPPVFATSSKGAGEVSVSLYDYRLELEPNLQTSLYEGTNGAPGVLYEGDADGLKATPRPIALGDLTDAHFPAPQVNAGVRAHQLHDGVTSGAVAIFDRGDAAGFVADGSLAGAAFDAYAPAAAHWALDPSRGLLKINGSPVGALTFGCKGDAAGGYVETTGPILARVLARAGVAAERIGASVAGLDSDAVIGAWFGDAISAREAAAWIARSAPAALLPARDGVWQAFKFGPPAVVAALSIDSDEVLAIEADEAVAAPIGEFRVGWGRIWQTFKGTELAPSLSGTSAETRLAEVYRWATATDAPVKARFPRIWRTLSIETALRQEADALALAADLKAMFGLRPDGKPRSAWKVTLELTAERLALPLGSTVALTYAPDAIDDNFILLGEEPFRPRRDQAVWTLWG